jgi:hypothetical protein
MKNDLLEKLSGGDLRSIGKANLIVTEIQNQNDFNALFNCLYSDDRLVVMRAADAIEKITVECVDFLHGHKKELLAFCERANNIEFKWHLALILPRLSFLESECDYVRKILSSWLLDTKESKIVRTNSLQALCELSKQDSTIKEKLDGIMSEVEKENIPSLLARIHKIRRN